MYGATIPVIYGATIPEMMENLFIIYFNSLDFHVYFMHDKS